MSRWLVFSVLCVGLSVAIALGFGMFAVDPLLQDDVGGSHFNAPRIVTDTLGETAAVVFPPLVISICTILGIAANVMFNRRKTKTGAGEKGDHGEVAALTPFLISPIVIFSAYNMASTHPDGFIAALLSFQNGFFWQSVFKDSKRS